MDDRAWVASKKGLFELRRSGDGWAIARASFAGDPVTMVLPPNSSGRMLAALNLGHFGVKLHASDDAGENWHEVDTPSYPPQPQDVQGPPWKLAQIWSLEAVGDTVLAGTLPGGLFQSRDSGETWELDATLWNRPERVAWAGGGYDVPGIHSICPHPDGSVLVGVSCGGVWVTPGAGETWHQSANGMRAAFVPPDQAFDPNVQDPHSIVRCLSHPEVLWCQHHNGIWRSGDAGAGWTEVVDVPVSNFGFAVAVHPADPQCAWFVPLASDVCRVPVNAALVVNRTRDGGATFETLRMGLPQTDNYDVVYRHGLAVDSSGQCLLMGSTTGGLWASEDSGDSWIDVPARLPPIYAVRIG
jgi:hypothetical protein